MPRRPEGAPPSPRDHDRTRKQIACRGCGRIFTAQQLLTHEPSCRRSRVLPGMRFHITSQTITGGRKNPEKIRRPIEVEILRRAGKGFIVRSLVSGREIPVKSIRRFLDWNDFAPGLAEKGEAA